MDELIQAMSISELRKFKTQYKDNESVGKIVDGIIEVKEKEAQAEALRLEFIAKVDTLIKELPHPADVANVYMAWREVEVQDTSQAGEVVTIVDELEEVNDQGVVIKEAVSHTETRHPITKTAMWVVELNKGFQVAKSGSSATPSASKREVAIYKHNANGADEALGTFPSYSEFAKTKGIVVGTDSARRAVERDGYYGVATN